MTLVNNVFDAFVSGNEDECRLSYSNEFDILDILMKIVGKDKAYKLFSNLVSGSDDDCRLVYSNESDIKDAIKETLEK